MATKPTINDLSSSSRFTTSGLNARFEALKNAFAGVLGTDGASGNDNTMTGNLNMGSKRITNVATPVSSTDAARKAEITTLQTQIDNISTTGLVATGDTGKVSANDTTSNYLEEKIVAGTGITIAVVDEGGNETLSITADAPANDGLALVSAVDTTAGYLDGKLVAGTGITLTASGAGDETLTVDCTVSELADAMLYKSEAYAGLETKVNDGTAVATFAVVDLGTVTSGEVWILHFHAAAVPSAGDDIINMFMNTSAGAGTYDIHTPGNADSGKLIISGIHYKQVNAGNYVGFNATIPIFITGTGTLSIKGYLASYLAGVTLTLTAGSIYAYKIKDAPA